MDTRRILLAGGLAVAAFLIFTQVKKLGTPPPPPATIEEPVAAPIVQEVEYVDILIAAREIPFGSRITEDMLSWKQWPAEAASPDFITQDDQPQAIAEFAGAIVRGTIYESEPITLRKLVLDSEKGLMASLLSPGMRAVTTRISVDTAAGGFIQPGDHVDIILTMSGPANPAQALTRGGGDVYTAKTIFEDVKVLAIDQNFTTTSESGAAFVGSTATFEMSQTDAEILQQSVAQGDLTLTLRPMSSSGTVKGKSHARIDKQSDETHSVTVYRNGASQEVALTGQ